MHHSAVKPKQRVDQQVAKQQSFDEKFAEIKQLKEEGNKFFKDKNYEQAKDRYAQCIDGLNVSGGVTCCVFAKCSSLQSLGDTSTDEQRSHLFEQVAISVILIKWKCLYFLNDSDGVMPQQYGNMPAPVAAVFRLLQHGAQCKQP